MFLKIETVVVEEYCTTGKTGRLEAGEGKSGEGPQGITNIVLTN
jgi:hypothetical protein